MVMDRLQFLERHHLAAWFMVRVHSNIGHLYCAQLDDDDGRGVQLPENKGGGDPPGPVTLGAVQLRRPIKRGSFRDARDLWVGDRPIFTEKHGPEKTA